MLPLTAPAYPVRSARISLFPSKRWFKVVNNDVHLSRAAVMSIHDAHAAQALGHQAFKFD
jgi:hypothetical protein